MSNSTAQKWDKKYADITLQTPANPCFVLKQHSRLLPFQGQALELACGLGGNARFLAQCGLKTHAWDISDNALTVLNNWASLNQLPIIPLVTDLEQMILPHQQFDVLVVSRYLDRTQFSAIADALKPNGLLFYQTFLGPVQQHAPNNPDFYLKTNELTLAWPKFETLVYGEGWLQNENATEIDAESNHQHRYAWYVGRKK